MHERNALERSIRGLERHYAGHFHRKVTEWLATSPKLAGEAGAIYYLVLEGIEQGDSIFQEELAIRFRLAADVPAMSGGVPWHLRIVRDRVHDAQVQGQLSLFFTFTSELSLEENISNLREFVLAAARQQTAAPMP